MSSTPTRISEAGFSVGGIAVNQIGENWTEDRIYLPFVRRYAELEGVTFEEAMAKARAPEDPEVKRREQQERYRRVRRGQWNATRAPKCFRDLTWDDFADVEAHDPEALAAAKRWGNREGKRGLILRGAAGNGKTSMACMALHQWLLSGPIVDPSSNEISSGLFRSVTQVIEDLRRSYTSDDGESLSEMIGRYDAIVLDELGRQKVTDWAREQFHLLFDLCCQEGKWLILTTNDYKVESDGDAPAFLDQLDEATVSRLDGMAEELPVYGPDYREK